MTSMSKKKTILGDRRMALVTQVAIIATVLLVITSFLLTAVSGLLSVWQSRTTSLQNFEHIVKAAALAVESEFDGFKDTVAELGMTADLYTKKMNHEELHEYLEDRANAYGFKTIYITNAAGVTEEGVDFSSYNFYQEAIAGRVCLLAPQVTRDGTGTDIMISAPIYKGGSVDGGIIGTVIVVMDGKILSDILQGVTVGQTGDVYVIDRDGRTVADQDYSFVIAQENTIKSSAEDKDLVPFAEIEENALAGSTASGIVKYEGKRTLLCVSPLSSYGWAIGVLADEDEYVGPYTDAAKFSCLLAVAFIIISFIVLRTWMHKLLDPLKGVSALVIKVSSGDYSDSITYNKNDEIGDIVTACNNMVNNNLAVINDVGSVLGSMAMGDFTARPSFHYNGEFGSLEKSVTRICNNMQETFVTIAQASQSVGNGACEVDSGATTLAQGTTEQAAAIEQLSSTLNEIIQQVHDTAAHAKDAEAIVTAASERAVNGNEQMRVLETAMTNIETTSKDISKIIKSIEDIAFQTNILALNAAVEAARAGTAGKGFSVVADEVRSLAAKSAEAAKNTTELIEAALSAVGSGVEASKVTSKYLQEVTEHMRNVVSKIGEITGATDEQSCALDQVAVGVDQISAVVQTNSATAEESAAASASMKSEADRMQSLMSRIKIK